METNEMAAMAGAKRALDELERARLEGIQQGRTEAALDGITRALRDQQMILIEIQKSQAEQKADIRLVMDRTHEQEKDTTALASRIQQLESAQVKPEDITALKTDLTTQIGKIETSLKEQGAKVDGFLLRMVAVGLTGGGSAVGLGLAALKVLGVLP